MHIPKSIAEFKRMKDPEREELGDFLGRLTQVAPDKLKDFGITPEAIASAVQLEANEDLSKKLLAEKKRASRPEDPAAPPVRVLVNQDGKKQSLGKAGPSVATPPFSVLIAGGNQVVAGGSQSRRLFEDRYRKEVQ